jgi:hypothetical protein
MGDGCDERNSGLTANMPAVGWWEGMVGKRQKLPTRKEGD